MNIKREYIYSFIIWSRQSNLLSRQDYDRRVVVGVRDGFCLYLVEGRIIKREKASVGDVIGMSILNGFWFLNLFGNTFLNLPLATWFNNVILSIFASLLSPLLRLHRTQLGMAACPVPTRSVAEAHICLSCKLTDYIGAFSRATRASSEDLQ